MDGDRKKEGVVMKQKLLFVIESLNCAGAEKSLTTLLNLIDYSKYEVDLQLFNSGRIFRISTRGSKYITEIRLF